MLLPTNKDTESSERHPQWLREFGNWTNKKWNWKYSHATRSTHYLQAARLFDINLSINMRNVNTGRGHWASVRSPPLAGERRFRSNAQGATRAMLPSITKVPPGATQRSARTCTALACACTYSFFTEFTCVFICVSVCGTAAAAAMWPLFFIPAWWVPNASCVVSRR